MRTSTLLAGAVAALSIGTMAEAAAKKDDNVVTVTVYGTSTTNTHKYGRFDKTKKSSESSSTGTHKYGRFDKTKKSREPSSTGTHKYGRFDKTKKSSESSSTGTHKYGRFDKTKKSSEPTSTGTHKYGRFDKTKKSRAPSSTGTHKYGRFDKTARASTTTVFVLQERGVSNASNITTASTDGANGLMSGSAFSLGAAAVAIGAVLII
ncbi:unnamed protein product [Kuraishia capsulata CBS 1993]|uniref:Hydrophilin n=1 Tax=Kuraishia capsulata CBS 1993 TaxID=1382522 RepID=W6MX91_9ASCO|nr:uncharacterized protein KUCA_T00004463001 [Kuraishia capsulata CBS 1993]CDK28480.1 unnamed protein product [Kuraishia capsulata CBS 1993]